MGLQVIDFRGLIDLDRKIIDQLEQYLKEKEARLSHTILNVFPGGSLESSAPILSGEGTTFKLSDAVEGFTRKARLILQNPKMEDNQTIAENVTKQLNAGFWEYTEVLESCVIELFQQIKQVNVDKWHLSISEVVNTIQEMLDQRIDDLIWAIRRIEQPLKEFCQAFQDEKKPFWKRWTQTYVDPDLIKNLTKSQIFLKTQYDDFKERYHEFKRLSYTVEESLDKMKKFPILALLDIPEQNLYVDVYRILKLIDLNPDSKGVLAQETVRSLKYLASVDSILKVFRLYYRELKDALFNSSLEFKSAHNDKEYSYYQDSLDRVKEKVQMYQKELQELINTINRYRAFILNNDSNPYVRSRWGFTERIVGPEPASSLKLLNLSYIAEELSGNYAHFYDAIGRDSYDLEEQQSKIHQEINKLLHEMGQPLISHAMMRNRADRLLHELKACDELGNPNLNAIEYVGEVLQKAMREDWKYHVLHEYPLFHEIYRLHQGLSRRLEDPAHAFRNERFHLFFSQIEDWVKKGDIFTHIHEIELDINDMKTYLQDFLASVQRAVKDKAMDPFLDETIQKYRQQLLEYRYIFGQFFSTIMVSSSDGQQLRNQFLFVDQYFETIENLLHEMQISWEGKSF